MRSGAKFKMLFFHIPIQKAVIFFCWHAILYKIGLFNLFFSFLKHILRQSYNFLSDTTTDKTSDKRNSVILLKNTLSTEKTELEYVQRRLHFIQIDAVKNEMGNIKWSLSRIIYFVL